LNAFCRPRKSLTTIFPPAAGWECVMDTLEHVRVALAERFVIERQIGQGGMATVYLARELKHRRDVALKVLLPELGVVLGKDRFLKEIQLTATLQHPHILPLFDSGEVDGLLY